MSKDTTSVIVLEENEKLLKTYEHIATTYWIEIRDIVAMKNVAFPDIDAQHFMIAMAIAKKYDLDPSVKEIYWWEKSWRVSIVASNAGFMKIARKQENFLKITANAVFPEDEFEMDLLNDEIKKHIIHPEKRTKESIPLGAYAILKMKDQPDQLKWVDWNEYVQQGDYSPWRKQKSAMIVKCATSVLCREAFWLSGLYGEEEMEQETFQDKKKKIKNLLNETKNNEGEEIEEIEEIEEAKKDSFKEKIKIHFNECEKNWTDPKIQKPNFDKYTEKQAKADFLLLSQI